MYSFKISISSIVCILKVSYICFSTHSCFLVIFDYLILMLSALFLVTVISLLRAFLCSHLVVVLMPQRYLECWQVLFLLFLSTFSLGCLALFLVWYSSQILEVLLSSTFRMVPILLQWKQLRYLSRRWNFCNVVWFSRFPEEIFLKFSLSSLHCWWCPLPIFLNFYVFSPNFLIFFRDKYVLILRNIFETLQEKTEKGTPNDEYENFVEAHLEAASKSISTKPRTKYRVPWKTLAVREKRALVKTSSKSYRKNPTNTNARKLENSQY